MAGLIALLFGLISLIVGFMLEGGHLLSLLEPTAAMIVFGGTIGAVALSFPIEDIKKVGKVIKVAFFYKSKNLPELVFYFREVAIKTRKNGLLSIEGDLSEENKIDSFTKKGLQMIVDGVEPQEVRNIMELQIEMTSERHKIGSAIFESAGGFSPTMGIIGTVMGLVHVLGGLSSSSPDELGASIATAFIATLYGVAFANLIYLPIGARLKNIDSQEIVEKTLITEAILFIQEGVNPNIISEKLKGFLNKDQLEKFEALDKKVG